MAATEAAAPRKEGTGVGGLVTASRATGQVCGVGICGAAGVCGAGGGCGLYG